jgi:hypothetical protein
MIMNEFDDERTMEEEEALEAEDDADELSALEQEQARTQGGHREHHYLKK